MESALHSSPQRNKPNKIVCFVAIGKGIYPNGIENDVIVLISYA
jgi:hypothetical protein